MDRSEYYKAWYAKNAEKRREYSRLYRASHSEHYTAYDKIRNVDPERREYMREAHTRYRTRHPDKARQVVREYGKTHRPSAKRRALKASASCGPVRYAEILRKSKGVCGICCKPLGDAKIHFDHKIPLARGGSHEESNIQATHAACNLSKGAKLT